MLCYRSTILYLLDSILLRAPLDLKAGRLEYRVVTSLLRFWEARNVKKFGELMSVDFMFLNEKVANLENLSLMPSTFQDYGEESHNWSYLCNPSERTLLFPATALKPREDYWLVVPVTGEKTAMVSRGELTFQDLYGAEALLDEEDEDGYSCDWEPVQQKMPVEFVKWCCFSCTMANPGFLVVQGYSGNFGLLQGFSGHKIFSVRILASISIDVKSSASIDIRSSSRQLPLARQTDHSSVKRA
ncbi:hypothetical protein DY000_02052496 [Brassica cretica]|uniref:Uncharacterized protein n=1 Tax=Brassica cretica TaxID=69181 RepID=A0ABQ7ADP2_BRACR|nr:hypothetical protein DY000_02052496 [Brassica cretica]